MHWRDGIFRLSSRLHRGKNHPTHSFSTSKQAIAACVALTLSPLLHGQGDRSFLGPLIKQETLTVVRKAPDLGRASLSLPRIMFGPPSPALVEAAKRTNPESVGTIRQLRGDTVRSGSWEALPGGRRMWSLVIRSESAHAIRLQFRNFHVADGDVWIYGLAESHGPYNQDGPSREGEFWSHSVDSDTVRIAYFPKSKQPPLDVPFEIAGLAHMWSFGQAPGSNADASCYLDATCYAADWGASIQSTAQFTFAKNGFMASCSGTMLNNRQQSGTPYFLTANHCVADQKSAAGVESYWGYQTSTCNGITPSLGVAEKVLGADFLAGVGPTGGDISLLRLGGIPRSGFAYSGWSTTEPAVSSPLTVVGHPQASYKRIAFGIRLPDAGAGATIPADKYYYIESVQGRLFNGASGGGWFAEPGILIGVVSGGPGYPNPEAICSTSQASWGGRLAVTFDQLGRYLNDDAAPFSFEPSLTQFLPAGFYIVEATLATGAPAGFYGLSVLTTKGLVAGGFNLGGALPAQLANPGFGAFYVGTTQTVSATLTAQTPPSTLLTTTFLDINRKPVGTPVTGLPPQNLSRLLAPGFYVVEVLSPATAPVTYQLELSADSFSGGVNTGGYIGAGITGFGSFYVPEDQEVTIRIFGRRTYGASGAGDLVLTLRDGDLNIIETVRP